MLKKGEVNEGKKGYSGLFYLFHFEVFVFFPLKQEYNC